MKRLSALLRSIRPTQWTKNGLLFAGALFAHDLTDPRVALRSVLGFICFCMLSGAIYLANDLRDLEADRLHPVKRKRPIASGDLPPSWAWAALVIIIVAACALAWFLGPTFSITAVAFLLINFLYNFQLKRLVLLDVISISTGFVLRAIAGVELIRPLEPHVEISPWLLVCTFFLALFLGFGKRRQEIVVHQERAGEQRVVLKQYTVELLDMLNTLCAGTTLVAYAIYTIWPATVAKVGSEGLLYTVPFVAYGLFRYLWIVLLRVQGEDPSAVLIKDRPLLLNVVLWALVVALVLYVR
ncbi:MAG TPA: decaprenyl-phosphate phosphoribosyltransferase [Candidatus Eisenbacteria bacterium]|nr:decaprenyl-phosphate phosphoribosyltransferase [Candidatus Eisenbacteria bacterium]